MSRTLFVTIIISGTYIIELLFRVKLYKECKAEKTNLRKRIVQNTDKLRILENKS